MSKPGAILMLALVACTAVAQQKPADQMEGPVPKSLCRFSQFSPVRQVIAGPSFEDLARSNLLLLTDHRVFFRKGMIVSVSRREGAWSCVTGWIEGPTSGGAGMAPGHRGPATLTEFIQLGLSEANLCAARNCPGNNSTEVRTGWMKSDMLGPVEEQPPMSVTHRTKGQ